MDIILLFLLSVLIIACCLRIRSHVAEYLTNINNINAFINNNKSVGAGSLSLNSDFTPTKLSNINSNNLAQTNIAYSTNNNNTNGYFTNKIIGGSDYSQFKKIYTGALDDFNKITENDLSELMDF